MRLKQINIIISIDPTTDFLFEIIENLGEIGYTLNIIEIYPTDTSYIDGIKAIKDIPDNSTIIFLGHGTATMIYGGESKQFEKKKLISIQEMRIFENQNIFILACESSKLLKSSFRLSKFNKSIGFGSLPTSIEEIENDSKLSKYSFTIEIIEEYKNALIKIISDAFKYFFENRIFDFILLKDYIELLMNKRINQAVLEENNPLLGDLLFKTKNEMVIY